MQPHPPVKFRCAKLFRFWQIWLDLGKINVQFGKLVAIPARGLVVRAFASQSVDAGFHFLVESDQKTLKVGIRSFPA